MPTSQSCSSSSAKRKRPTKLSIPDVLQDIPLDKFTYKDLSPGNDTVCFFSSHVAVSCLKGQKKFMEDTHTVLTSLDGNPNKGFFGVYDGHGGRQAVDFVARHLHENILKSTENCDASLAKEEAVKAGYLKTDEEFLEQGLGSGACCVTAVIEEEEIVVSNVGDCRAVLCRGGKAEALTKDHRAEQEDERQRIEDKGGFVEMHRGAWRVHGVLSVSRSIGDAHLKPWIVAEPVTRVLKRAPDMEFLVLASDGLWEKVGNQEAVDVVTRHVCMSEKKTRYAADLLKDENESQYGCVNVSPSAKLRRISLVKQQKKTTQSPSRIKPLQSLAISDDFSSENDSRPSKLRKISITKKMNIKNECVGQENCDPDNRFISSRIVAACKELVDLAITKGSLDDITVMVIDLKHFSRQ